MNTEDYNIFIFNIINGSYNIFSHIAVGYFTMSIINNRIKIDMLQLLSIYYSLKDNLLNLTKNKKSPSINNINIQENIITINDIVFPYDVKYDTNFFKNIKIYAIKENDKLNIKRYPGVEYNFAAENIKFDKIIANYYDYEIIFDKDEILTNKEILARYENIKKNEVIIKKESSEDCYDEDNYDIF